MKFSFPFLILFCALPSVVWSYEANFDLNVEAGAFDAAKVRISYNVENDKYNMKTAFNTSGTFGKLYKFDTVYNTSGQIVDDNLISQQYSYVSKNSSNIRTKEVFMNKQGEPIRRVSSKNNKYKEVLIDKPEFDFDAPDMQTVLVMLIEQFKKNNFCDMHKTVFDGKKTYSMLFTDEGKTENKEDLAVANKDVWKCALTIKNETEDEPDFLTSISVGRTIYLWIAKDKQTGIPYLLKLQIDSTPIGAVKAYTKDITLKE